MSAIKQQTWDECVMSTTSIEGEIMHLFNKQIAERLDRRTYHDIVKTVELVRDVHYDIWSSLDRQQHEQSTR